MSYGLGYSGTPSINSRVSRRWKIVPESSLPPTACSSQATISCITNSQESLQNAHGPQVFASHLIHQVTTNYQTIKAYYPALEYTNYVRRRVGRGDLDETDYWCRYWVENPMVMGLSTWADFGGLVRTSQKESCTGNAQ
jgi:hypothetical protein